ELDQRIYVGEGHVVGARRDAVDRLDRAARGIDGHVEAFGPEVAAVERQQEGRLRAFIFPIERKFYRGLRGRRTGKADRDGEQRANLEVADEVDVHAIPLRSPALGSWGRRSRPSRRRAGKVPAARWADDLAASRHELAGLDGRDRPAPQRLAL